MDSDLQSPQTYYTDLDNSNGTVNMSYGGYYQPQWGNGYYFNPHMQHATFNPSLPAFQPNGTELSRAQPRTVPDPSIQEMQKWITSHNIYTIENMAKLDRKTHSNSNALQHLTNILKSDLDFLHNKIMRLEAGKQAKQFADEEPAAEVIDSLKKKVATFSKENAAQVYLDEAADKESTAVELRKLAEHLLGRPVSSNSGTGAPPKQIEAPPSPGDKVVGFACCGTAFSALGEMLDHVNVEHTKSHQAQIKSSTPDSDSTVRPTTLPDPFHPAAQTHQQAPEPTSKPRSASTKSRSRAIEIKPPQENTKSHEEAGTKRHHEDGTAWTPFAVRQMKPFSDQIPVDQTETFSAELLHDLLRGRDFCDGFHFVDDPEGIPIKAYWILDEDAQPFLPKAPGQHGAKLSMLMNEEPALKADQIPDVEHYMDVPVFIRAKNGGGYRYYGNYSQSRFSDKIDYDNLKDQIPDEVLRKHASRLAENGRPSWVTEALIKHFFPRPEYWGQVPTDSAVNTPKTEATSSATSAEPLERGVKDDLTKYAQELKEWSKSSRVNVGLLTEEQIYQSFFKADTDLPRGLRPFWEYFECVDYQPDFYKFLCAVKKKPGLALRASDRIRHMPTPRPDAAAAAAARKAAADAKEAALQQAVENSKKPTIFVEPKWFTEQEEKRKANAPHLRAGKAKLNNEQSPEKSDKKKAGKGLSDNETCDSPENKTKEPAVKTDQPATPTKTSIPPHLRSSKKEKPDNVPSFQEPSNTENPSADASNTPAAIDWDFNEANAKPFTPPFDPWLEDKPKAPAKRTKKARKVKAEDESWETTIKNKISETANKHGCDVQVSIEKAPTTKDSGSVEAGGSPKSRQTKTICKQEDEKQIKPSDESKFEEEKKKGNSWEGFGDLNAAKAANEGFKENGTSGPKRKVPPHLRGRSR